MKVLTANRLIDGEAVWLGHDHAWRETIEGAAVASDKTAEDVLEALGQASLGRDEVIDVNLIDVELAGGLIRPLRLRERIRATGPTNRTDLGKQAQRPARGADLASGI